MRRKNRTSALRRILASLVCVAALAAGGLFSVLRVRYSRTETPLPSLSAPGVVPFLEPGSSVPAPADTLTPPRDTDTDRKSVFSPAAQTAAGPAAGNRPSGSGGPRSARPRKSAPADLSAYRPQARSDRGESCLPRDKSLSAKQLKERLGAGTASDDDGKGFLGDLVRGTRRVLKSFDDATLDASRRALGSIARPDEAKIRPYGDGARLHIGIPADTVNLRRKGRKK